MAVYKRGRVYWYKFEFQGKRHQGSTRLRNERLAQQYESKLKADLAMARVGLAPLKAGPTLAKYADDFRAFIETRNAERPRTIGFYKEKLLRLLYFKPLADCRIDQIDEKLIDEYVQIRRKSVGIVAVNREVATLRRMLHVARDTHKLITRIPKISLLPHEPKRDFVLNYQQEAAYLAAAGDTLHDFALLSLDTGLRLSEGVNLEWADVYVDPIQGARLGHIHIREGKSDYAKRRLSLSGRVKVMLENRRRLLRGERFVFPSPVKQDAHVLPSSLDHLHTKVRATAKVDTGDGFEDLPREFVIHSLRHTFGTRLGETGADAFKIQKIMGHHSVTVSQRYVHPTPESLERAFEVFDDMNQIMRGDSEAERKLGVVTESVTAKKGRL